MFSKETESITCVHARASGQSLKLTRDAAGRRHGSVRSLPATSTCLDPSWAPEVQTQKPRAGFLRLDHGLCGHCCHRTAKPRTLLLPVCKGRTWSARHPYHKASQQPFLLQPLRAHHQRIPKITSIWRRFEGTWSTQILLTVSLKCESCENISVL